MPSPLGAVAERKRGRERLSGYAAAACKRATARRAALSESLIFPLKISTKLPLFDLFEVKVRRFFDSGKALAQNDKDFFDKLSFPKGEALG